MEEEFRNMLETDFRGNIVCSMANIAVILKNDLRLSGLYFNDMKKNIDICSNVPWRHSEPGWNNTDMAGFQMYMEKEYGIYAPSKCRDTLIAYLSSERARNPVTEYLNGLKWDGIKRLDKLLINCFGAEDTNYVRTVTRKTIVAAISRAFSPGIKFDTILVLCGRQGIGKSTLFKRLAREWYTDSVSISDMKDKTAAEKIQGAWITELGELAGLKKIDVETVKSFLSRADDQYRIPYGTYVDTHPRHGIIVGTTNKQDGFLRDITGNRRFWPVMLKGIGSTPVWSLSDADIDQIWAEGMEVYRANESIYLSQELESIAAEEQRNAMESDPREGLIQEYLQSFEGDRICLMQIWCECLKHERQDMKRTDAYELEGIMHHIPQWKIYSGNASGKMRISGYGIQRTYVREGNYEV